LTFHNNITGNNKTIEQQPAKQKPRANIKFTGLEKLTE